MIEKYCEIDLSDIDKNTIRDDKKIQTLTIKHTIAKYLLDKNFTINQNDVKKIIENINNL